MSYRATNRRAGDAMMASDVACYAANSYSFKPPFSIATTAANPNDALRSKATGEFSFLVSEVWCLTYLSMLRLHEDRARIRSRQPIRNQSKDA
jgi:hypothetical protein